MKPLEQWKYKAEIVKDPMEKEPDKPRRAWFKCEHCKTIYNNDVISEAKKQQGYCWMCYQRHRYPNFMDDYDAIQWLLKNQPAQNKYGYFGVRPAQHSNKWVAEIKHDQTKTTRIGTYITKQEAALAYDKYVKNNNLNRKTNIL